MHAPVEVGQIVGGKYEVERVIAHGGAGVVVKARHVHLLEPCAIKFLLPDTLETPMARQRFLREARACARLKSDHVVRVFDVGELDAETPYMVLEYLEGVDLETRLESGPLPVGEAALYVLQICAALAEAHARGIVHRDIKPANVFLARGDDGAVRVKLLDFGISKVLGDTPGDDQSQTLAGTVMGTPYFMAPEQVRGEAVDARADVWAVGVLLYLLLTGVLPFEGKTPPDTLASILTHAPRPPSRHLASVPPELDAIILRCMAKSAAARPRGVDEIAVAVEPFAEEGARLSRHVRRVLESSAGRPAPFPSPPDTDRSPPPRGMAPEPCSPEPSPAESCTREEEPPSPRALPPPVVISPPAQAPPVVTSPPSVRNDGGRAPGVTPRASWTVTTTVLGLIAAIAAGVALAPRSPDAAAVWAQPLNTLAAESPAAVVAPVPPDPAIGADAGVLPANTAASSSAPAPPISVHSSPKPKQRSRGFDLRNRL